MTSQLGPWTFRDRTLSEWVSGGGEFVVECEATPLPKQNLFDMWFEHRNITKIRHKNKYVKY